MTRLEDRQILERDIRQACSDGARLAPACAVSGIDARTLQRWKAGDGLSHGDHRVDAVQLIEGARESDKRQIRRVQHQFDRHEDDDRVAACQHADDAQHKQHAAQADEDWKECDKAFVAHDDLFFSARTSTTAPIIATSNRIDVASKGNR